MQIAPWLEINPVSQYLHAAEAGTSAGQRNRQIFDEEQAQAMREQQMQQDMQQRAREQGAAQALQRDQLGLSQASMIRGAEENAAARALQHDQLAMQDRKLAENAQIQSAAQALRQQQLEQSLALGLGRQGISAQRANSQAEHWSNLDDTAQSKLNAPQFETVVEKLPAQPAEVTPAIPASSWLSPSTWGNGKGSPAITNSPALPERIITSKRPMSAAGALAPVESSAPSLPQSKTEYSSPAEVKADYRAGKIDQATATSILASQFGYESD